MRVLITGAAGQIGSQIVDELSRAHELCLIDIRPVNSRKAIIGDLSVTPRSYWNSLMAVERPTFYVQLRERTQDRIRSRLLSSLSDAGPERTGVDASVTTQRPFSPSLHLISDFHFVHHRLTSSPLSKLPPLEVDHSSSNAIGPSSDCLFLAHCLCQQSRQTLT